MMPKRTQPVPLSAFLQLFVVICLQLRECRGFLSHDSGRAASCLHRNLFHRPQLLSRDGCRQRTNGRTRLFMGDHSSATLFEVGDIVTVVEDVMKAGKNLRGRSGTVIETWEKCDVDPTCCCAEWVDEGLSVHVRFNVDDDEGNGLFANDTFVHYFAESELVEKKEDDTSGDGEQKEQSTIAFDGMSCKAFKLDKLSMGEQARRIAAFEESREKERNEEG